MPYQVSPMSEEWHDCNTCGTHFQGNYCPRCGQSEKIERYSFKMAAKGFMDVWGLGNRGMFRTLRDLLLRPGYMIRDYLKGMQMAYFPPFKMFFLLTALSILVTHGFNIKGEPVSSETETSTETTVSEKTDETTAVINEQGVESEKEKEKSDHAKALFRKILKGFEKFHERFPEIYALAFMLFISGILYLFFRHSPNIPDMRYSELFVALVYSVNMYSLYSIVLNFLYLPKIASMTFFLTIIPLKQLSGYGWWRTICYACLAGLIMISVALFLIVLLAFAVVGYSYMTVK